MGLVSENKLKFIQISNGFLFFVWLIGSIYAFFTIEQYNKIAAAVILDLYMSIYIFLIYFSLHTRNGEYNYRIREVNEMLYILTFIMSVYPWLVIFNISVLRFRIGDDIVEALFADISPDNFALGIFAFVSIITYIGINYHNSIDEDHGIVEFGIHYKLKTLFLLLGYVLGVVLFGFLFTDLAISIGLVIPIIFFILVILENYGILPSF